MGGAALSVPLAQLQSVIVLCEGNTIKAFSNSGRLLWEYKSRRKLSPYISLSRTGISYICGVNGDFVALNRAGKMLWTIKLPEPIVSAPLSGWDNRIFLFLKNTIQCYTSTGSLLWKKKLDSFIAIAPLLDQEGGFITVLDNATLMKVNAFGKSSEIKLKEIPFSVLSLSLKKTLVVHHNGMLELYQYDNNGIRITGGNIKALQSAPLASASSENLAAFQLGNQQLVLWSQETEEVLWQTNSSPGVGAPGKQAQKISIQFDENNGKIYVLSISGAAGFSKKGVELMRMRLEGAVTSPALDEEGFLYSSGRDWILYTYHAEEREQEVYRPAELPPLGTYGLEKKLSEQGFSVLKILQGSNYKILLDEINADIIKGTIGESEPFWVRTLIGIADDSRAMLHQRLEAIHLLGVIGSPEIVPVLISLLNEDKEEAIRAGIVTSLGRIGANPGGQTLAALSHIVYENRTSYNDLLLFSTVGAIGNLCRFSGPPSSGQGIELLSMLASQASVLVSRRARQELEMLWKQ
ncbi:MAG: PQQ-binding-like beta-propeller repeat protein [Spirochaetaceae bacterium]|nr:PQQ-binding-like beta-propeller repeat protein [Spirochaetaceae bacterium]